MSPKKLATKPADLLTEGRIGTAMPHTNPQSTAVWVSCLNAWRADG